MKGVRIDLQAHFVGAIRAILAYLESVRVPSYLEWLRGEVSELLIYVEELDERILNSWVSHLIDALERAERNFRKISYSDDAATYGAREILQELATCIVDALSETRVFSKDNAESCQDLVRIVGQKTRAAKESLVDGYAVPETILIQAKNLVKNAYRTAKGMYEERRDPRDCCSEMEGLGHHILSDGHADLSALHPDASSDMLTVGRKMHLLGLRSEVNDVKIPREQFVRSALYDLVNKDFPPLLKKLGLSR